MKSGTRLSIGFLYFAVVVLIAGCAISEESKRRKEISNLRIHVEADPGSADRTSAISVHRTAPILLNIDREAVLDESEVSAAAIIGQPGELFSVEIQFTRRGG